jgi:hypothetical protein
MNKIVYTTGFRPNFPKIVAPKDFSCSIKLKAKTEDIH